MCDVKSILRLGGGSISDGLLFTTQRHVRIPSSVELINKGDFHKCATLCDVTFSADSCLREIAGFYKCNSLCRIEIPSSVEIINYYGFQECVTLNEIIFSVDSRLREIHGFQQCKSLSRINIPSSVEIISGFACLGCASLHQVTFAAGTRIRTIKGFKRLKVFFVHKDNDDLKQNRPRLHLFAYD
jgi:hypothetical protein